MTDVSLHDFAIPEPYLDAPKGKPERQPGEFDRDANGTPIVADPSGDLVKSGPRKGLPKTARYSRPSGYGKLIEDSTNLQKWAERMIVAGFVLGLDDGAGRMLDQAPLVDDEDDTWRDFADSIARAAKDRARAMLAADRGTHAHNLTDYADTERDPIALIEQGVDLGITGEVAGRLLNAWRAMLDRYGLKVLATEMPVVNDTYRTAGTLDRIVELTRNISFVQPDGEVVVLGRGLVVVLDLKTGKLRVDNGNRVNWWESYAVQVALYAGSVAYDPDTDTRSPMPWPVDQRWAIIAHLDVLAALDGREECNLILVDLEQGRRGADLVKAAKDYARAPKFSLVGSADVADVRPDPHKHSKDFAPAASVAVAEPPDEGAPGSDAYIAAVKARYLALPDAVRKGWIGELERDAVAAECSFHTTGGKTMRRLRIIEGLTVLAAAEWLDDDAVKALVRLVTDEDAAMWLTVPAGVALGSLGATEAAAFVEACTAFVDVRYVLSRDDHGPIVREVVA